MRQFFDWIKGSFDNTDIGASAKKLTAFIVMLLIIYLHFTYCTIDNVIEFLICDAALLASLLGLGTIHNISLSRNKNTDAGN